jgi:hypothetical protein
MYLFDAELRRLIHQKELMTNNLEHLKRDFHARVAKIEEAAAKIDEFQDRLITAANSYKSYTERSTNGELRRAKAEIAELRSKLEKLESRQHKVNADGLSLTKATTLAIFDTILFQISNWSNQGDTASDFELLSQAVLFPSVYERVVKGDNDAYFLDKVPDTALDVVNLGREWIRDQRKEDGTSLASPTTWRKYIKEVSNWWINEALPMIYDGAKDPNWDLDEPYHQQEMIAWRDFPANRPLAFPRIFDGIMLIEKYSEEYTDTAGIPKFVSEAMELRIDPE